jgi:hypothetical protein
MAIPSLKLGNGEWAVKETKLLATYPVLNRKIPVEIDAIRATTATRVNDLGFIESVGTGIARIDYSSGEAALLIEPQRTNVIIQSNGFQTSSWGKAGSTAVIPIVTPNSFESPDGTTNSALVEITSVADGEFSTLTQSVTSTSDSTTLSVFLRAYDASQVGKKVALIGNGTGGVTGSTATLSLSWQRFTFNRTSQINQILIGKGRSTASSGNITQAEMSTKFYIYEAQLEVGNNATSIIPTTTTAVTRNQDLISKTGISDLINSQEGVIYLKAKASENGGSERNFTLSDGTSLNRIQFAYSTTANKYVLIITYAAVGNIVFQFGLGNAPHNEVNKFAIKYKSGDIKLFINGVIVYQDTPAYNVASNLFDKLKFSYINNANPLSCNLNELEIYKTALTDAELITLTTI